MRCKRGADGYLSSWRAMTMRWIWLVPYQWGATGPDAYDCSALAMMAYRAAGLAIPRTSQAQWD